jgi:hypothetical protein
MDADGKRRGGGGGQGSYCIEVMETTVSDGNAIPYLLGGCQVNFSLDFFGVVRCVLYSSRIICLVDEQQQQQQHVKLDYDDF